MIIIFHELGHFLLAKRNGIAVTEFSLGMGPRLLSKVIGETRYSLKLFPIGGSCMMVGEDDDDDSQGSFNRASVWARISVVAAGPIFNFILAFIFAMIITSVIGYDPSTVLQVEEGSPAQKAGLQEGDVITEFQGRHISIGRDLELYMTLHGLQDENVTLTYERDGEEHEISYTADSQTSYLLGFYYNITEGEPEVTQVMLDGSMMEAGVQAGDIIREINGVKISTGQDIQDYIAANPLDGSEITLGIERNGDIRQISITPKMTKQVDSGFVYNLYREKTNFPGVIKYSAVEVRYWITSTIESLVMLVKGQFTVNDLSGPVGIINVIGDSYEEAKTEGTVMVWMMLYWAILLSANLGVMNLLPIPALDGGRLVFLIIEAIRRKKINPNVEGMIHFAGFVLLMVLMVFVMFNDIRRI